TTAASPRRKPKNTTSVAGSVRHPRRSRRTTSGASTEETRSAMSTGRTTMRSFHSSAPTTKARRPTTSTRHATSLALRSSEAPGLGEGSGAGTGATVPATGAVEPGVVPHRAGWGDGARRAAAADGRHLRGPGPRARRGRHDRLAHRGAGGAGPGGAQGHPGGAAPRARRRAGLAGLAGRAAGPVARGRGGPLRERVPQVRADPVRLRVAPTTR